MLRSDDPEIQDIATNVDWYFVPVMNPDGFVYTKEENRNWRKSRTQVSLVCYGVDPNRNFGFNWLVPNENGNEGASRSPCSDTYAGAFALSESETKAVDDYLTQINGLVDVYLALHSYAHQMLHPYGHTTIPAVC